MTKTPFLRLARNHPILGTGVLVAIFAVGIAQTVFAAGPAFGVFPISYDGAQNTEFPLLDARDATTSGSFSTSQADHDNGVTVNPGDEIEFIIFYHNGAATAPENIAHSVRISANLPVGSSQTQTVSASISADNATTIDSSSHGGDMQIHINSSAQTLQYIPGSTRHFPNRSTTGQTLPDGIVSGGVNIGDIQGCWDFSGFVKFRARVSGQVITPTLTIEKTVMNVTNSTGFQNSVSANPSDVVRFKIVVRANGGDVSNLVIRDILPSTLLYNSNTTRVNGNSVSDSSGFFGSGYSFGTLAQNSSAEVQFEATLASFSFFNNSTQTVTNTSNARGDNVSTVQDTADITVSGQVLNSSFTLSKSAYNQTQGINAQSVMANPGDIINYTLTYHNTGSVSISNVVVSDDLSGVTPYADMINAGEGTMSGNTIQFPAITVPAGVSIDKTFQVRVRDVAAGTNSTMTNTYGNQVNIQIRPPIVKGTFIPPKTGPAENFALLFAFLFTGGVFAYKKYPQLKLKKN